MCVQITSDDMTATNQMSLSLEGTLDIKEYWKPSVLGFHLREES
jgi:hypothetical protein